MAEESKRKISLSKKGRSPAWNRGKKMPGLAKKMLGNKNGRGNKGRSMSSEWLAKLSLAKIGKPSPVKGKKYPPEHRLKMSLVRREAYARENHRYSYDPKDILRRDRKGVRRERLLKNGGVHSTGEWEALKARHNYTCKNCGKAEPAIKLTRDHIIAVSQGGSDNIENIQPLCVSCNSRKGTTSL